MNLEQQKKRARGFVTAVAWIADRARGLLHALSSGVPAALDQIREWHPRFADATNEDIQRASLNESDARLVYAREHGFEHWDDQRAAFFKQEAVGDIFRSVGGE